MDACAYHVLGDAGLADALIVGLVAQPSHGGGSGGGDGGGFRGLAAALLGVVGLGQGALATAAFEI